MERICSGKQNTISPAQLFPDYEELARRKVRRYLRSKKNIVSRRITRRRRRNIQSILYRRPGSICAYDTQCNVTPPGQRLAKPPGRENGSPEIGRRPIGMGYMENLHNCNPLGFGTISLPAVPFLLGGQSNFAQMSGWPELSRIIPLWQLPARRSAHWGRSCGPSVPGFRCRQIPLRVGTCRQSSLPR